MDSSEKTHLNKEVRAKSLGALLCLTLGLGVLIWALWPGAARNQNRDRARMQSLAYQILEMKRQESKNSRSPASELGSRGQIGADMQGRPYSYELKELDAEWLVSVWIEQNPQDVTEVRIRKDQLSPN